MNRNSNANNPYFSADSANGVMVSATTAQSVRNSSTVEPIVILSPSDSSRDWIV
jgi:hypothetical protein